MTKDKRRGTSRARLGLILGTLVLTAASTIGLGGLYCAGAGSTAMSAAIRPTGTTDSAGRLLPPAIISGGPQWRLSTAPLKEFAPLKVRVEEVPLRTGATASVVLEAASARLVSDPAGGPTNRQRIDAEDVQITVELSAAALGTAFQLSGPYLTAYSDGSLAGGYEHRGRLSGRITTTDGQQEQQAWEIDIRCVGNTTNSTAGADPTAGSDNAAAEVVIGPQDHSAAGRDRSKQQRSTANRDKLTAAYPPSSAPRAATGAKLRIGPGTLPLGLSPQDISIRARTIMVTSHRDRLSFAPAALTAPLEFAVVSAGH